MHARTHTHTHTHSCAHSGWASVQSAAMCFQILDHLSMIENRNESELEAHLRRVVKHSNLHKSEKSGLRGVRQRTCVCTHTPPR